MADSPPPPAVHANVLDFWQYYTDGRNALYKDFADEAFALLAERRARVARLESGDDWAQYREEVRRKLMDLVGPFPQRTPLNPRVVGGVHKGDFRIERIIYESQPGLYVTAALYIPEPLRGKAPAIVYCSGHTDAGFRGPAYQTVCQNLVRKGFVVLAFDPIGQGERLQYVDPNTHRSVFGNGSSTREHTRAGTQCFLTGSSLARHMIWDGIRTIDYLVTRTEVDPSRIGITGRSGGGTQSAYIAAVDERIRAAAPENYLTTFEQLLKSRGPQDPEQNFYRGLARRWDQADLVIARAPRPTLIVATTRDIFSIEGTRTLFEEARRGYIAFGEPDALTMVVDDAEHTSTKDNREALYAFFQKHLGLPGDSRDLPVEQLSDELRVTETGQVATSLGGETVFSLNRREAALRVEKLEQRRRDLSAHLAAVKKDAARLAGYTPNTEEPEAVVYSGRFVRDGYIIEKYLLPVDDRYAIPLVAWVPDAPARKIVMYFHPQGKSSQSGPGGELESLVKQGCTVIAPDIRGVGELGPGFLGEPRDNPPRLWYAYVLLGKSIVGRQMDDVMRIVRFAQKRFGVPASEIVGLARGELGPLLLHTAAIENVFGDIALVESPLSYRSMTAVVRYQPKYTDAMVPAALTAYDLPDLAACLAPRKLLLVAPRDGGGELADIHTTEQDSAVISRAYELRSAGGNFVLHRTTDDETAAAALRDWLR